MVSNTSELLPEPETPVNTVIRRFGSSMLTSLRLFSRAPTTRIRSWVSAACGVGVIVRAAVEVLDERRVRRRPAEQLLRDGARRRRVDGEEPADPAEVRLRLGAWDGSDREVEAA